MMGAIAGISRMELDRVIVEVRTISHRSDFSRLIERDPPILSVSKVLFLRPSIGEIFLRVLVHLDTDFFSSINFELRFTKYGIFQETIVNPFKIPLDASLSSHYGQYDGLFVL